MGTVMVGYGEAKTFTYGSGYLVQRTPHVLAIDPGTTQSAWCKYLPGETPIAKIVPNEELRDMLRTCPCEHMAVEWVTNYGMAVGAETYETVYWTGRFCEAWNRPYTRIKRTEVKLNLCGSVRAKDANVRISLIDRFGGESVALARSKKCLRCKGEKTVRYGRGVENSRIPCPKCDGKGRLGEDGPLNGITSHMLSALAVAVTYWDLEEQRARDARLERGA